MLENSGGIAPLNWDALVREAVRRRKTEKMTQKEHAALASVSIPTIIAFDRGERTLSLAKATAILRVVGLVDDPVAETSQEAFVSEAFGRWRELTNGLPKDSPGRFPKGWYRVDYALDGDLKEVELHKFPEILRQAVVRHTGWPMFRLPKRAAIRAGEVEGVIECWMKPEDAGDTDRLFGDAAHCDFWRAAPEGRLMIIRGYQEDGQETFPAGSIFDTTLPIWRMGEAFLHASKLAKLIARDLSNTKVRVRFLYTGLQGRSLRAWASPMSVDYFGGGHARSDEAMLEGTAIASEIDADLARHVYPMVSSLFERFNVTGISEEFVAAELERMRTNNFGD
jgi:transcriptional regulator with XRE-family HTH domain